MRTPLAELPASPRWPSRCYRGCGSAGLVADESGAARCVDRGACGPPVRRQVRTMLSANQVVLIEGDRIAAVGPNVKIPGDATVLDFSRATVLPGMIDTHVHLYDQPDGRVAVLPDAGRGPERPQDPRRRIHDRGRSRLAGRIRHRRHSRGDQQRRHRRSAPAGVRAVAEPARRPRRLCRPSKASSRTRTSTRRGWRRAAVREAKLRGVDWIKIYTTQDFVGAEYRVFKPDGTLVNARRSRSRRFRRSSTRRTASD